MVKALVPQQDSKKNVIKVLIVDDIPETRDNLKKLLAFEPDIDVVGAAGTGREGLELAQETTPDIILMDINMPDMDGIAATELIRKSLPRANVIMMSVQNEADYMRRAMLAGARYFLTKPISGEELYSTVRSVYDSRTVYAEQPIGTGTTVVEKKERHAHVIVVYSPQGGAGKTTIATNLAAGLMKEGTKVLLIDCNLQFPSVDVFLNLRSPRNLMDLMGSVDDLDEDLVENVLITHDTGLRVLLGPANLEDAETIAAEKITLLVEKLTPLFDYIVLDTPSELSNLVIGLCDAADRIMLVVTPTLPGFKALRTVLKLFEQLTYPEDKPQIVFNRVTADYERAKIAPAVAALEQSLRRKSFAAIPLDEKRMLAALNRGTLAIARERNLSPARELLALADMLRDNLNPSDEQAQAQQQNAPGAKSAPSIRRLFGN
ncbi:MAG TPA: response regulator [Aggregatilineales bacterium]|nr:response regulator [Aggregatilineales bacterium]